MPKKSRGKRFESEVYQLLKHHPQIAFFQRWPDIGLPNPVDFTGCLQGGKFLALECKSIKAKSLAHAAFVSDKDRFNGDKYGKQWRALERCWVAGAATYVFVNAYGWLGRDGLRGRAWAVPFQVLRSYRETTTRKSWPLSLFEKCDELGKVGGSWTWEI